LQGDFDLFPARAGAAGTTDAGERESTKELVMNRTVLALWAIAAPLAVSWVAPAAAADPAPAPRGVVASDSAASAVKRKPVKRKKVAVVRKTPADVPPLPTVKVKPAVRAAPAARPTPAAGAAPAVAATPAVTAAPAPASGVGPSIIGPSAAASAGGPGFAVIANPAGAAASSPPRPDAGAPTAPNMK